MAFTLFPKGIPPLKRLFDICVSAVILIIISPVIGVVALAILIFDGTPVFFRQERPGYKGKIFRLVKFRSMRAPRMRGKGAVEGDADRITKLGKILRRTSLDELPELWNVLRGEMSLVGPRPLLVTYLERYSPEQARRHDVLPGITGWAQVNGRNLLTWEDRFRLDVWYVDRWSFGLDLRILVKTLWNVVRREGIESAKGAIMEEFKGTPKA